MKIGDLVKHRSGLWIAIVIDVIGDGRIVVMWCDDFSTDVLRPSAFDIICEGK